MNLLVIQSSINAAQSASNSLVKHYIQNKTTHHSNFQVEQLNLAQAPFDYLDNDIFAAFSGQTTEFTSHQQQAVAQSEQAISKLKAADELLITLPLYNLGFPATLKTWLDYVCRAGLTFQYTSEGPKGLINNVKATIILTSGWIYADTAYDTASQQLKNTLGLIGITDVTLIRAEGLARTQSKEASFAAAEEQIKALAVC